MNSVPIYEIEEQDISSRDVLSLPEYRIANRPFFMFGNTITTGAVIVPYIQDPIALAASTTICSGLVVLPSLEMDSIEICTVPAVRVQYNNRTLINEFLNTIGQNLLDQIIDLIQSNSLRQGWPLSYIDIEYLEDIEIEDWHYVLLNLIFDTTFEHAEIILCQCYELLDELSETLNPEAQEILQQRLYLNAGTIL